MSLQKHFDDGEEMHHKQPAYLRFIVKKIQNPHHLTVHESCKFCTSQIGMIKCASNNTIINQNARMCIISDGETILND